VNAALPVQLALHGAIILMAGLVGGLCFARAIQRQRGEVAWRVVHAGGCSAGVLLLALAVPSQWMRLGTVPAMTMAVGFIAGAYLLCAGMYIAAICDTRGIPGGGAPLNRLVAALYASGTVLTLLGGTLLVVGLLGRLVE